MHVLNLIIMTRISGPEKRLNHFIWKTEIDMKYMLRISCRKSLGYRSRWFVMHACNRTSDSEAWESRKILRITFLCLQMCRIYLKIWDKVPWIKRRDAIVDDKTVCIAIFSVYFFFQFLLKQNSCLPLGQ